MRVLTTRQAACPDTSTFPVAAAPPEQQHRRERSPSRWRAVWAAGQQGGGVRAWGRGGDAQGEIGRNATGRGRLYIHRPPSHALCSCTGDWAGHLEAPAGNAELPQGGLFPPVPEPEPI